jgi:hypothetical protein
MATNITDLYSEFDTFQIDILFEIQLLLFAYQFINNRNFLPIALHNLLNLNVNIHKFNTRLRDCFHIENKNSAFGRRCVGFTAAQLYNKLPTDIKSSSSLNVFKQNIYRYYRNMVL